MTTLIDALRTWFDRAVAGLESAAASCGGSSTSRGLFRSATE